MGKRVLTGFQNQKGIVFVFILMSVLAPLLCGCTENKKGEVKGKDSEAPPSVTKVEAKSLGCEVSDTLPGNISMPLEVNYGGKIKLRGITVDRNPLPKKIEIAYFWEVVQDLGVYQTVFVHFRDSQGNLLFQNDHDFCQDSSFHEKIKGKYIREAFLIPLPALEKGTKLDIKIGIYDSVSGKKLAIKSGGKTPADYDNTAASIKNAV